MYKLWAAILILSFISCSGENTNGGQSGTPGTTGGEVGNEGQGSEHWIFSVPFKRIEAGSFIMGSPSNEENRFYNEDQVEVTITKSFEIMEKEFTQKQWFLIKKKNPSYFKKSGDCDDHETVERVEMCPNHPVEQVSWDDVQDYIRELNVSLLGLTGCNGTPQDSSGCYRLPTEAEWEYAVRGRTTTAYFFGDDSSNLEDYGWYLDNSGDRTHKVGLKSSNPNELYDVYGNVSEWVQDSDDDSQLSGGTDPLNTSGRGHVTRGGSWYYDAWFLRSASRVSGDDAGHSSIGFRLVRTL